MENSRCESEWVYLRQREMGQNLRMLPPLIACHATHHNCLNNSRKSTMKCMGRDLILIVLIAEE
ncbi:hypothetical protein [Enterovibrio norvegicus]|uniref:hypothetical protein n=1 Tax=Enterovibrio norvegicus TaxID=188144 RepID=UPI00352FDFE4